MNHQTDEPIRLSLTLEESIALLTAQSHFWAHRAGIDVLVLKGPLAVEAGLRPSRPSADVDILLRPSDAAIFDRILSDLGWLPRPHDDSSAFMYHSESYYHRSWSVDIDVHHEFPGFEEEPEAVFDYMWNRRCNAVIAGVTVEVPDLPAMATIQALHALRSPWKPQHQGDLDFLSQSSHLPPVEEIVAFGHATKCLGELQPWLQEIAPDLPDTLFPAVDADWLRRQDEEVPGVARLKAAAHEPWHRKPLAWFRVFFPSRTSLAVRDINLLSASPWQLNRERARRLIEGASLAVSRYLRRGSGND